MKPPTNDKVKIIFGILAKFLAIVALNGGGHVILLFE